MRKTFLTGICIVVAIYSALALGQNDLVQDQRYRAKIYLPTPTPAELEDIMATGVQLWVEYPDLWRPIEIVATSGQLEQLRQRGYRIEAQQFFELTKRHSQPVQAGAIDERFHTYETLGAELDSLARAFPHLTRLDTIGTSTQFHRLIWAFKVSDNASVDEDEPQVLYIGVHHASEVMGLEIDLLFINELLQGYGKDPTLTRWVNDLEIWFIPLFNPDGHYAVTSGINLFWRKNARDIDNNGIFYEFTDGNWWTDPHEGIDLNRNYSYGWEEGSSNPWAYNYRGSQPFSESENQAMRDFIQANPSQLSISFHSYGEVIIYPWADRTASVTPDDPTISDIAGQMAERMPTEDRLGTYNFYRNSANLGYIDNWLYADHGTYNFTVEVNPYPVFIPHGDSIQAIYERIKPGITYLLERVTGPGLSGHITDATTGRPLDAEVQILEAYRPDLAPRTADTLYGRYYRLLLPGRYAVMVQKSGYITQVFPETVVNPDTLTILDVALVPENVGVEIDPIRPVELVGFRLAQNYPNPFNAATTIHYHLNASAWIRLVVFNARGQKVQTLLDQHRSAGAYSLVWNGLNNAGQALPSGVYFCQMQAGNTVRTRKMILLR